jgi:pilus assembly protein CpaB
VSIFAVLFAAIAAWLASGYLQREINSAKAVQPEKLVVAAADIPIGATITQPQVRVALWPKDSIPAGSAQAPDTVVNRVAVRPIAKGDAVTEQKLKPKNGAPGTGFMTYVVPQGHRAVTVAVNEVAGVAGFLTPSDRVDVVVTTPLPYNDKESVSKIILDNVPVLATGQITDQKSGKPVVVPTVTLDLLPADAEKLVLSASKGTLQMLLRNIADSSESKTRGATIAKVLSGMQLSLASPVRKVVMVKAPPRTYSLTILRGAEKSSKQYAE